MNKRKWIILLTIASLVISLISPLQRQQAVAEETKDGFRTITAAELVKEMGLGWNLGNTLDSYGAYNQSSNFQLVGYYMDGDKYVWNMSSPAAYQKSEGTSVSATLTWNMKEVKSADASRPASIGFQLWNFSREVYNGMELEINVKKAEVITGGKTYSFPELLGSHTLTVKDSVASLGTDLFDKALAKTSQLKAGTFTLTVEITKLSTITKQQYFETLWGNPMTTKAIIDKVKAAGFNAVRVPVTWYTNMDENGIIEEAWLDRSEEIVNYILDSGMYCIINSHHDTGHRTDSGSGWLKADTSQAAVKERFTSLWKQVAERFEPYGDHLLFEGFNEILIQDAKGNDIWGYPGDAAITSVNELNQIFVDTVRKSGGNNAARYLVVNTYAASSAQSVIDGFVLPEDTIEDHLIVEVHDYTPMEFGWYDVTWTAMRDTWGTNADKANLDALFDRLDKRFVSKGIPVIIGEFGTCNKNNTSERAEHAGYYVSAAAGKGITCFWWDNGGEFEVPVGKKYEGGGLINRRTLEWPYQGVVDALVNAAYGKKIGIYNLSVTSDKQLTYTGKSLRPKVSVRYGEKALKEGTDYSITYRDNKNPGKATIIVTGTGDYHGTTNLIFYILPSKTSINDITSSKPSQATLSWSKSVGATGYQLVYSTSKNGVYKNLSTTSKLTLTVNKLARNKTYYFKVRAYIMLDQVKYYGNYSDVKSIRVK